MASVDRPADDAPCRIRLWERVGAHQKAIHDLRASSRSIKGGKKPYQRRELTRARRLGRLHAGLGIRASRNRRCKNPGGRYIEDAGSKFREQGNLHKGTCRTNSCCAITLRRDGFSNDIAMPPATAPATIECHRADFRRSHVWCACATKERRASLFLVVGVISIGESESIDNSRIAESSKSDDDKSFLAKLRRLKVMGTFAGKRRGNALRRIRYIATKHPGKPHK